MVVQEKGEGGGKHQGVFILFFLYSTLGSFERGKKRFKKWYFWTLAKSKPSKWDSVSLSASLHKRKEIN